MRTDRDEFIYRVENGFPVSDTLLRAIADRLKRSGAPVKTAYRNQCIAALAQFLVSEGQSVTDARKMAFEYFDGPEDDREHRRIVSEAACTLRLSVLGNVETLLLWEIGDREVEARVLRCLPTTGDSNCLSAISDNGDCTYALYDLSASDPPNLPALLSDGDCTYGLNDLSTDRRDVFFSCRVENRSLGIRSVRERLFAVAAGALKPS